MTCRGCFECLLKLLNFILTLTGLTMVGYGIYLFVLYTNASSSSSDEPSFPPSSQDFLQFGRPLMMTVSLNGNIFDNLPKAWFIYLFIGIGGLLFLISCCGCIGTSTRNGCCLTCYSMFLILLILIELGCAAFIFFDNSWKEKLPSDETGNFDFIYDFLDDHWDIVKWVALGIVIFQGIVFLVALIVRASNKPTDYDSDDEYIAGPRQQIRQPLINNRQPVPATGVPVVPTLDTRPSRSDAWSTRMREKYGLDTSEFTYNPAAEGNRNQQNGQQGVEEKSGCVIM